MKRRLAALVLAALSLAGCGRGPSDAGSRSGQPQGALTDEFLRLMNVGKNHLDQGEAAEALAVYGQASALVPNHVDVQLNLANARLQNGEPREALRHAENALKLEPNLAAAHFVTGSAHLRLSEFEQAVKALENTRHLDPGETATLFQLGRARMGLSQWEEAIAAFREGIRLDPNRLHRAAHYLLAQALLRAGRPDEAQRELERHQLNLEERGAPVDVAAFERCAFTQARTPFRLEQPDPRGIDLRWVDATRDVLGDHAATLGGPVAVLPAHRPHRPGHGLIALEKGGGFRVLRNVRGTLHPDPIARPSLPGVNYTRVLVGDLQNDRREDVIALGDRGSQVFTLGTNDTLTEVTASTGLAALGAIDGMLLDLDFTGKLDLLAVTREDGRVRVHRQTAPLTFADVTAASGVPEGLRGVTAVQMEDWSRDGIMDVIASREDGPPWLLEKQRGGPLVGQLQAGWPAGAVITVADFDNDLRPDLAVARDGRLHLQFHGGPRVEVGRVDGVRALLAVDHDNDGWLDLWAVGTGIRAWRNRGLSGFEDRTAALGLDALGAVSVAEVHFADWDGDCDPDAVVALAQGGLRFLRNEGGNANAQVTVHLVGNRSNASGLGCRVQIETGGLRLVRTVRGLPVEVGVGRHQVLDSFLVHWFNWPQGSAQVPFDCREPLLALELTIQEGSCPYLYAWDGQGFRFVTDILGAAPLGLPLAEGRLVEADPEEFVWVGNEDTFPPRDGSLQVQITEELREVLYLDAARLVVVDRQPGTEVHPTDKLLPGGPFPPGELMTLHREQPLRRAETLEGREVTDALRAVDGHRASPPRLRVPQLRGLAEPHGWTLDFGPLDGSRPLVLVMNGWLRFGGGMANMAASHDPSLPFPFPVLEAETAPEVWQAVDVTVGAPAGKTKTILVDLEGRIAPGTRRLRLRQAFEIHWDRVALLEKTPDPATRVTQVLPTAADLHFRGFSRLKDLPPDWPQTPDYDRVEPDAHWTLVPGGWCTRYGDVAELVAARDEGLALVNAGDELTLKFAVDTLPPKPPGSVREFFLYVDGWDKDSDFHVVTGAQVEPLPFHGMNDQRYGRDTRPAFPSDALHRRYNSRWVEGRVPNPRVANR